MKRKAKFCHTILFKSHSKVYVHILFAHLLIAHSLICSDCSSQMSDCEQIAQVAHVKRVTMNESLRLLMINERANEQISSFFRSKSLICSFAHKKRAICSNKFDYNRIFYVFCTLKNPAICSFPLF